MKRALVTGITGQDGSYLAELLLSRGWEVHGLVRRVSVDTSWRIAPFQHRLVLHDGDITERGCMTRLFRKSEPDVVFNLAAQSFVNASFEVPEYTVEADGFAVLRMLEEIRNSSRPIRLYQASTSEMFGSAPAPQDESTVFHPRSPYGCAKLLAHSLCVNYREAYGLHVSCGLLFNHESPRRGEQFVTRKIAMGVARIAYHLDTELRLGNLNARRDWGFAGDYVEAMLSMVEEDEPDDYVIATGESHSVQEFAQLAFDRVGLDWSRYVKVDPKFSRPADVEDLRGDASKARRKLDWRPKVTFQQLVRSMVDAELEALRRAGPGGDLLQ